MLSPEAILAFVDAPPGAVVVDYGAGTGAYAVPFALARPDCRIVAIDIEPQLLDVLRAKPEAAAIRSGGPDLLAELSGSIDRVYSLHVMHYLGLSDLRRILGALAPGGRAAFVDWNGDVERPRGPAKDRLWGAGDAERLLVSAGFIVERTLQLPYHYAFFGRVQP
ncbi:MAG: class I SAM-dependent methyltransferase [Candidatus Lustribacter sp.]